MKSKTIILILFFFCVTSMFSQEEREQHPLLTSKFQFEAGVFIPSKSVRISVDGSSPNNNIDFDEAFKLNQSEATLFFNFDWRFSEKWKLSAEYFGIKNANKAVLKEDLEFDDITFNKGSNIRGGFGINMFRIYVGRSFIRKFNHELGVGLGVHALNTTAFIAGDVLSSEGDVNFEKRSVSALVPLPNLGFWYFYTPNEKWMITARLDWFGITIGDYSGSLWNIAPGVKYQLFKHISIGADYRYFNVKANVNKTDWTGQFRMIFQGPLFVVHANF